MKPKILFYDIETSPNLGYVWGKYEQNVLSFLQERELLSVAYKWQGSSAITVLTREGQKSDLALVKKLHKLLSEADVVVAHNGDQFDARVVKARMLFHQLRPLKRLVSVDTKKAAKSYFYFNGNGLNDLGQFLKLGKKLPNPGIDLWLGCIANKRASWRLMERYNKQDVVLLEKVYERLRPWVENHPNLSILRRGTRDGCPACGSLKVKKSGVMYLQASQRQRMCCLTCGRWYSVALSLRKAAA